VARNFRDKARMKTILGQHGLPCARHCLASDDATAVAFADRIGFPLVLKPPAGAGAQRTFQVDDVRALGEALRACGLASGNPVQIEEFVAGDEHSFETVSIDGRAVWHSLTHYHPTPLDVLRNPWIQWCVVLPREIDEPRYDDIRRAAFRTLEVLGMDTGLTHLEWFRRRDGSLAISEVAARPPGAQITSLISWAHDIDFLRTWARLMVYGVFDPPVRRYAVGAAYLRGQGRGDVRGIHGLEAAQRELGSLVVEAKLPTHGQTPTGSYEGEGYVILRHAETAVVEQAVRRLVSLVRVELG
jgi:formate-dependent phosphoribosylglycinamide formyltransferase (GAR transformylase)